VDTIRVLGAAQVRSLLTVDSVRDAVRRALIAHARGATSVPPRIAAAAPGGLLAAMPGWVDGIGLAAKLVSVFPGNVDRPSHQALIAVFDDQGSPVAVLDGTGITALRTAAASALAVDVCTKTDIDVLAILGAGVQGHSHLEAIAAVRSWREIRVASRNREHAGALAARDPRAIVVGEFEEAARGADAVLCCTDASEPVVDRDWLAPHAHVGSVGSGCELDAATVAAGQLIVEWRGAADEPPPAGARDLVGADPARAIELGAVLTGDAYVDAAALTVYKSTGHACEDVAVAAIVVAAAVEADVGTVVDR